MGLPDSSVETQTETNTGSRTFLNEYDPNQNAFTQAIGNLDESGKQLVNDVISPFLNPIQTAKDIYSLGSSVVNLFRSGEQGNEDTARAVGQFFKDRYGGLENIKKTFATDPLGMLADVSIILTGGTTLVPKTAGTIGQVGRVVNTVGKAIDPVTQGLNVAGMPLKLAPYAMSKMTGVSSDALKTGYAAGQSSPPVPLVKSKKDKDFTDAMRGNIDYQTIVADANKAFEKMQNKKKSEYLDQKTKLKLDEVKVDFSKIDTQVNDWINSKTFEGVSELSESSQKILQDIQKQIDIYKNNPALHNAKGLDILKRKIDNMYPINPKTKSDQMVVTAMKNIVKDEIIKQVPDYAKVMEAFETASLLEKQLIQELSLGKHKNAATTLKKLQSIMRNNANTNYGGRLQAFNALDNFDEFNIKEKIAGMELSSYQGRGLNNPVGVGTTAYALGSGNLAALGILPFMSPRLTGEAARLFGKYGQTVKPTVKSSRAIGLLEPTLEEERRKGIL
jgi:hypothetical protein